MTLLEAMASSTPILSTGVGGIPEILAHGHDALLVEGVPPDYRSPPAESDDEYLVRFTTALSRLLSDVDLQEGLCRRALERVRKEFSLEVICDQYEELFSPLIAPVAGQRPAHVKG